MINDEFRISLAKVLNLLKAIESLRLKCIELQDILLKCPQIGKTKMGK